MAATNVLSEVLGAVFVLVGLSVLNKKYFMAVMNDLKESKGLTWTLGVITFIAGAVTIGLNNVWSSNLQLVITIIGWLMLIKGTFITLFPNTSISFYRKLASNSILVASGVVAVIIGLVLWYLGSTGS